MEFRSDNPTFRMRAKQCFEIDLEVYNLPVDNLSHTFRNALI